MEAWIVSMWLCVTKHALAVYVFDLFNLYINLFTDGELMKN